MNQLGPTLRAGQTASAFAARTSRSSHTSPLILSFLIAICLPPTIATYAGPLLITPYRLYMIVLLPYLLFRLFADRTLRAGPADLLVMFYGGWTAFCLLRNLPTAGVQRAGQTLLETVGAYLLARVAIRSMADLFYLVKLLFAISMIAFALCIPEAITYKKFVLDWTSDITGMPYVTYFAGTDIRMGLRRPQAFFASPILYGLFCASAISLIWYATRSTTIRLVKTALLAAAAFLALSSGPLLAVNVQILMIIGERLTRNVKQRSAIAILITVILTVLLDLTTNSGVTGIIVNHLTFNSDSAFNRILIWQWGTYNIMLHPFLGLDPDNWIRPSYMKPSCDDFWIAITMTGGLPCLAFLVGSMGIWLWKIGHLSVSNLPKYYADFRRGWLFSFLAFAFTGFSVFFFGALQPFFFFTLGSAGALVVVYEREAAKAGPAVSRRSVKPNSPGRLYQVRPVTNL